MKHKNIFKTIATIVAMVFILTNSSYAQCNSFVKKKCMPNVLPFTQNGQMNTSTLTAGQSAEMNLTFYAGQDYRILVCFQEQLGDVTFKVMDASRKVIFESKDNNFADFWDFKVKNTQQFIVEVTAPPSETKTSIVPSGCVSVLVGFKKD